MIAPERTLVTTRVFDAPRELVYRAWTDPKQLAKWFPPEGFTSPRCEVDPRPGGVFRVDMKAPDGPPFNGTVFPGPGVFREVVPNERLAFTMAPEIEGQTMPKVLMTVRFEDQAGKTKLTVEQTLDTVADYETMVKTGMAEGIRESLDKLAGVLSGNSSDRGVTVSGRTLTLVRVFNAPRELVWTAYTDPQHIMRWMFANDWESPFAETDLRAGGAFRIGMRPADHGHEGFVFDGTYREIIRPERIVQVIGDGRVMTTTFDEVLSGTRLTLSLEMAMGEEQERAGYSQILDHFAAHLATLSGKK
ncbi:MAG TPA: SRPBCC domain-containing protein [Candidatus Limnocylindria bacterium]|nr:SRPBCC domain-containing protein [Candidatus Limnocylindria bacterium]